MKVLSVLAIALAAFGLVVGVDANAGGAPAGSAQEGCTCHTPNPSGMASVSLDGLPDAFEPGTVYNLTMTVSGPDALPAPIGQNQGGFDVMATAGSFSIGEEMTMQLRSETEVTHTTAGNNQRSWSFSWEAPVDPAITNVTFYFAGNAVNGDMQNNQLDNWNLAELVVPSSAPAPANNTTSPTPSPDGGGLPGPGAAALFAAVAATAAWIRFRRMR